MTDRIGHGMQLTDQSGRLVARRPAASLFLLFSAGWCATISAGTGVALIRSSGGGAAASPIFLIPSAVLLGFAVRAPLTGRIVVSSDGVFLRTLLAVRRYALTDVEFQVERRRGFFGSPYSAVVARSRVTGQMTVVREFSSGAYSKDITWLERVASDLNQSITAHIDGALADPSGGG